jgi:thymidylate synthase (FAD)
MREVEPEVYVIASTVLLSGLEKYLASIGQGDWETDAGEDADILVEAAGRLCYRSWSPHDPNNPEGTNPNVVRVREGNQKYIANLMGQMHGSVLEHASISFLFKNVSRVFTHELVRHRAGMGYSQESMRYVLLTDLPAWIPPDMPDEISGLFRNVFALAEQVQKDLAERLNLAGMDFNEKKLWTSRLRRLVPMGVATNIIATGNLRSWLHIFTMRSSPGAEEEIRLVQDKIAPILKEFAPSVFSCLEHDGTSWRTGLSRGI